MTQRLGCPWEVPRPPLPLTSVQVVPGPPSLRSGSGRGQERGKEKDGQVGVDAWWLGVPGSCVCACVK